MVRGGKRIRFFYAAVMLLSIGAALIIQHPDWSPDGKKIALSVAQDQNGVLLFKNIVPRKN